MRRAKVLLSLLLMAFFWGCAAEKPVPRVGPGLALWDQAALELGRQLRDQMATSGLLPLGSRIGLASPGSPLTMVFDPFMEINNAVELRANRIIRQRISRGLGQGIKLTTLSPQNVKSARYALVGVIAYEKRPPSGHRAYYLASGVLDLRTGRRVAQAGYWIRNPPFKPLEIYRESPLFLKDQFLKRQKAAAMRSVQGGSHLPYLNYLVTKAHIQTAYRYFGNKEYALALKSLAKARKRADGKNLAVFDGMYKCLLALGRTKAARGALRQLFKQSLAERNALEVRILFEVNSELFIQKSPRQAKLYALWLEEIARLLAERKICLTIVGHSSRSGPAEYNQTLSLQRAKTVQRVMSVYEHDVRTRTEVMGKGFSENIVGSGSDDARDMIDRRVEFKASRCP